jgi:hypothetical protein
MHSQQQRAMERRIVGGEQVESAEIEELQNQARHESLMVRTQLVAAKSRELADGLHHASHGVLGRLANGGDAYLPVLIDLLRGVADVMTTIRVKYMEQRGHAGTANERIIATRNALIEFEDRLNEFLSTSFLPALLDEAASEISDAQLNLLVVNFGLTLGLMLTGTGVAALASRGAQVAAAGEVAQGSISVARAAMLARSVGVVTSFVVNTAGQKYIQGDEASLTTIALINVLTPWAISKVGALLPEIEAAGAMSGELSSRWVQAERMTASLFARSGMITGNVVAGAAVNYMVRRAAGEHADDPTMSQPKNGYCKAPVWH